VLVVRSITELRDALREARPSARPEATIGFVPTMGALHDGHLSLVRAARAEHETVVLSIFVNPKQFEDGGDFSSYPRDEARDLELARAAGVDVVFLPDADEMYPQGFATTVSIDARLTAVLEGAVRGVEHFNGMATVVSKLLIAVQPDTAYFGAKDFQQLVVVRRLVADLGLQVNIVGCPTLREADGLALSSRNVRLSPEERRSAAAIPEALAAISAAVRQGERDTLELHALGCRVLEGAGLRVEYLAFVQPDTLQPMATVDGGVVCAVAVATDSTRLIDNELLIPPTQ
jgi:pantoate--beta-alanine ligase